MKDRKRKIILIILILLFMLLLCNVVTIMTPYWQSRMISNGHYSMVKIQIKLNPNFVNKALKYSDNLFLSLLSENIATYFLSGTAIDHWYTKPLFLAMHDKKMLILLLDNGADPNIKGMFNETPLQRAIRVNNLDSLKILLKYKADPNLEGEGYMTSLKVAIQHNNIDAVKLLLKFGANPNLKVYEYDESPLEMAIRDKNITLENILRNNTYIKSEEKQ